MKRPDRFPQRSCVQSLMSARGLRWRSVMMKPVRSGMVESLCGRMGATQSTRQALGRACRDLDGLFESLLAEAFS